MSYSPPALRGGVASALTEEPSLAPSLHAALDTHARVERSASLISWFADIDAQDVPAVGGKAASLGEMFGALADKGVRIPNGFATTVAAYDRFLDAPVAIENWVGLSDEADSFIEKMQLTGGSIGSNDLVQTVYAVSRDDLGHYDFPVDARSPAVKAMIPHAVSAFKARGLEIGICGQAPSDYPEEVPGFLVGCGITSISVTPDTVIEVRRNVSATEQEYPEPEEVVG